MTMTKPRVRERSEETTITYPRSPFVGIPNDGDGDGGFVCFICDRAVDRGEPLTCISRRLEICQDSQNNPSVIDAVASLQVCIPCTLLSVHHELRWVTTPKLLNIEMRGFYAYARLLAETIGQVKSDTRVKKEIVENLPWDSSHLPIDLDRVALLGGIYHSIPVSIIADDRCLRCCDPINFSKPHTAFEISIDVSRREGIEQSNIWRLGKYCNACSKQLLPLYDRLW